MKRKLQVVLNDETWTAIEGLTKEANDGFINGTITYSDILNEILLTAKLDIRPRALPGFESDNQSRPRREIAKA